MGINKILSRRSIRKYKNQPVPDHLIEELLKAAMAVPSTENEQIWHFVVINDRGILNEIPKYHPYSQMLREAPVAIVVCGDEKLANFREFWIQDCSAATENILIAAQDKGLGAVWLGVYPVKERVCAIRKLLRIPEDIIPFSIVAVGYPAEHKPPANRYNPDRIHYNRW